MPSWTHLEVWAEHPKPPARAPKELEGDLVEQDLVEVEGQHQPEQEAPHEDKLEHVEVDLRQVNFGNTRGSIR